jgi:hypothetical protein
MTRAHLLAMATILGMVALFLPSATTASTTTAHTSTAFNITGLDLHDGMMLKSDNTYYLYGTEYGCGFTWQQTNTPWCGFGVSTSTDTIRWTTPTLLFSPTDTDTWTNTTWTSECGATGTGCFNPRMIQRTNWGTNDGVWILWFNAPADYNRTHANPYYALGCNGPTGPCGAAAGTPHGSTHKPNLNICGGNGDFDIITTNAGPPTMLCTNADQTLSEEQLDTWGTDGNNVGSSNLAGLTNVESPGAYYDTASSTWILTYSDPNCGYCTGTPTGYATATSVAGPWTTPTVTGLVTFPAQGRRDLSATSCGGQPRTISTINGQPYEGIDLWTGARNETAATLHYEPLTYTNPATNTSPWQPFQPWTCH